MKLRFSLPMVAFMLCGLIAQGQVTYKMNTGFENGDPTTGYTATPSSSASIVTAFHASGARSMDLSQSSSEDVVLELGPFDFSQTTGNQYIALLFDHICDVIPNGTAARDTTCSIWYKQGSGAWKQLTNAYYDKTGPNGYSNLFRNRNTFNNTAYSEWSADEVTNAMWRSERFNMHSGSTFIISSSQTGAERTLSLKFVLQKKRGNTALGNWHIDNLRLAVSTQPMARPTINMVRYPDFKDYPHTRVARIQLDAISNAAGFAINADSVNLYYRYGSNPTVHKVHMTQLAGYDSRFAASIPFDGYDTIMSFYCTVRDLTNNNNASFNTSRFPSVDGTWQEFRFVRSGNDQLGVQTPEFTGNGNDNTFPFPTFAANKSEWVFDSATMANAGYGPGGITSLRFYVNSRPSAWSRQRFQLNMKNAPTDYTVSEATPTSTPFTSSFMHSMYDDALSITRNDTFSINLTDTFFYAGKDLVMQVIFDDPADAANGVSIKTIPAATGKKSITANFGQSVINYDPWNDAQFKNGDVLKNVRPAIVITEHASLPLLNDAALTELIAPTDSNAMICPGSLVVKLKNPGARPLNSVRITYNIDSGAVVNHHDWTGNLAYGQSTEVTLTSTVDLNPGFHNVTIYVEDTVGSGNGRYRDHEPLNDTLHTSFTVCSGPMSGVITIGGPDSNFASVDDFLVSLRQCGMLDSLIVRLAPGRYKPFALPRFSGLEGDAYIAFEPRDGGEVIFYASSTAAPVASSIIDISTTTHVHFRNLKFVRYAGASLTNMVKMVSSSRNCHFEGCQFIDSLSNPQASLRIAAMLASNAADSMVVENCRFIGGKVGLNLQGQSSSVLSKDCSVRNCYFSEQYDNAVNARFQRNLLVDGNQMYSTLSTSNVLVLYECYGATKVIKNRLYASAGAGTMGASALHGTQATPILIANNMMVREYEGTSAINTAVSISSADWTDVVYNSVKQTAARRSNTAALTFGASINNCRFLNNIVVNLDESNYAFNYTPGAATTNTVGHNVYYSLGVVLNKLGSTSYPTITAWKSAFSEDSLSISTNPNFLDGSLVDLRTFSRPIAGMGIPVASVTTDIYDSLRDPQHPSAGAFQFEAVRYDFEPVSLLNPVADNCYMPDQNELILTIRNTGILNYDTNTLTLAYQINGGDPLRVQVTDNIRAEHEDTVRTGAMLHLPYNGTNDSIYNIRVWTEFTSDPNQTNDTNNYIVISRYHPAIPADYLDSVDYATPAVITPTEGVDTWVVSDNPTAPLRKSQLYWFRDSADVEPFYVGHSFTTDTLRQGMELYFSQKRSLPIVRLTQMEIAHANTTQGVTPDAPSWLASGRKYVFQLTNLGDDTARLEGDILQSVSTTASSNGKQYIFGDVRIAPGEAIVVQFVPASSGSNTTVKVYSTNGTLLSTKTVNYKLTISSGTKIGYIFRHENVIEDAIVLNGDVVASEAWTNLNVPSYVWGGDGIAVTETATAGFVRTGFVGGASDWSLATDDAPMFLNNKNDNWIRYTDNGCVGGKAKARITMRQPPTAELELMSPTLPEPACGLGLEDVTVTINNYGTGDVVNPVLHYLAGGNDTVTETMSGTIPTGGQYTYTFTNKLNMAFDRDTMFTVKVWVDSVPDDRMQYNDTSWGVTGSIYTPAAPAALQGQTVSYASRATLTHIPTRNDVVPVWYNYDLQPVDTGSVHTTEILYSGGTMAMSYVVVDTLPAQVGTGTSPSNKTAYPNPYQAKDKYVKEQYIYSAADLLEAGAKPGPISELSFYLDSLFAVDNLTFTTYRISMGLTTDTIFSTTSAWKDATSVFYRAPFTIYRSSDHWVKHTLDTPFVWDGVSSIVVQVTRSRSEAFSSGVQTRYTTKANTTLHKNSSNALTPSLEEYSSTGTKGNNRPNIIFNNNVQFGCAGPYTPFELELVNIPSVDMAMTWPGGVDTLVYNSCGNTVLSVNLRNQGTATQNGAKVFFYLDTLQLDSTLVNDSFAPGVLRTDTLLNRQLTPGRHTIKAFISAEGDYVSSNDTISRTFIVRFCGGSYTIALENGDYHSFSEAIDTMNVVGIEGPVNFLVANGTYREQVKLNQVDGASAVNTIRFIGGGDSVVLMGAPTQTANYVFCADGVSNLALSNISIVSRPASGNYANTLVLGNGSNINITNCLVKVKGGVENATASSVTLNDSIANFTFTNNVVDSGYYSIKGTGTGYSNIIIDNNIIRNFAKGGVSFRNLDSISLVSNQIVSSNSTDSRGLVGVSLANTSGMIDVQKNKIYLVSQKKGGMMGLLFEHVTGTMSDQGLVANNMISCSSTGTAGITPSTLKPSGIWIDSSSANLNFLFNSVRLYCGEAAGTSNDNSRSFFAGNTISEVLVKNNIFSNYSKGYAYYVSELQTVTSSDYNAYYSESVKPFAWKVTTLATLAQLQNRNQDDDNSIFDEPYFTSAEDLHLLMANYVGHAQYNSDVTDDIDGKPRSSTPPPTIGAHEMEQMTHDMVVVRILKPVLGDAQHIETNEVVVQAKFCNNGRSVENNVRWYAYIDGYETTAHSAIKNLGSFNSGQMKTDTLHLPTALGIIDSQLVHVVVLLDNDDTPENNDLTARIFLKPAYNLNATKMLTSAPTAGACELRNTLIKITLKNEGEKPIPANTSFEIGYATQLTAPANVTISTLPDTVRETATLQNALNKNATITLEFNNRANLYPTDTAVDIDVRVTGWCHFVHDLKPANDSANVSSKWVVVKSFYTPEAPVGYDTSVAYASWGPVRASQEQGLPIKWYKTNTGSPTAFYSPSDYAASTYWNTNLPQLFRDTTYYLRCESKSAGHCPSDFSPVTVHVDPATDIDMAMVDILAPLGNRVYMEDDTVRIRVANYSHNVMSNVPVSFEMKKGNTVVQTATEIIEASIAPNEIYSYTFNTLLDSISTPTTQQNYTVNAWTSMPNDRTPRNDTVRVVKTFKTLKETTYNSPNPGNLTFDITRVSFNEIDLDMPPLGRGYNNMATYGSPEYPVTHVTRGMLDTILIQITAFDQTAEDFRCRAAVYIDFDRSGTFTQAGENVVSATQFYSNETFKAPVTISPTASTGYMRMRVVVADYGQSIGPSVGENAHIIDFLLYVDAEPTTTDLAVTQMVSPRDYLIRDDRPNTITFRVFNKGSQAINSANFHYRFVSENGVVESTITWDGSLQPGRGGLVSLPPHVFPFGTTKFSVWSEMQGDQNRSNDTLVFEFNRFHIVTLDIYDNFDGAMNYWYAPTGYNPYSRNYWECGVPTGTKLNAAYSEPNAWVTDLDSVVATGKRGNVSYLYSPIIDISQIRSDTLSFRLRRNLTQNSTLHLEFYNFQNRWVKLMDDSATCWYNNTEDSVFSGTTAGDGYDYYWISTNGNRLSGDFNQSLQFRFVYTTPKTNKSNYGEGCAIDDFRIGRARRATDAGVVDIIYPDSCRYGETIYPRVVVKNFGYDNLRHVQIGYTYYGAHMPRLTTFSCDIAPDQVDTFRFDTPFTITTDYPDTFYLRAFTILPADIYQDNDSTIRAYHLLPLDHDISAQAILAPQERVLAGDTAVTVTLRMRNFGAGEISTAYATYLVNGYNRVDEVIHFDSILGRPLASMEYFNYTFKRKFHAGVGRMVITGIVSDGINDYPYNDTVSKQIQGISSVTDIAARSVVLTPVGNRIRVELLIENVGARGANNFEVGYMIDNDPSTARIETFARPTPLAVLTTATHTFEATLSNRSGGYPVVTGFVHAFDDNDPTNDSTNIIAPSTPDLEAVKVEVEENSAADCRVFIVVRNVGNISMVNQSISLSAVVNGTELSATLPVNIPTGQSARYEFSRRIPKSSSRSYVGSGRVTFNGDANSENDQTTNVVVVNYVAGAPTVDDPTSLSLEQNYPNPFSGQTVIPFVLPQDASVRIFVVDAMGHLVKDFEQSFSAGRQTVTLDLSACSAGVYYYGIVVSGERRMRKLILR